MVQHHKTECHLEKLDYCVQSQGHSKDSKCQWMFVRVIAFEPQNILFPNLVWRCSIMSQSVMQKKNVCYLQDQGHSEGSYDQNMTLSVISTELLILRQPDLVWWYIVISQCCVKKIDYCIEGKSHSEGSECQCLSRWYVLNHQTFCYQTWFFDSSSWARVSCKKIGLLSSRSRLQQIWQFLLYLLNFLSFCCQTWLDSTLS